MKLSFAENELRFRDDMQTPSGVITMTTDFGHKGPFAGVMRGAILSRFRDAEIVDLTHDIPAQWPPEAGFWVDRAYRYFPAGTVHVAVVDPGVGTERRILLVEADRHVFLAPDNGLLARVLERHAPAAVFHLDIDRLRAFGIPPPSNTFHGRDIFAPAAALLASGTVSTDALGTATTDWIPGWLDAPATSRHRIAGTVITIDAFGNLISDIERKLVARLPDPLVRLAGLTLPLSETYGRVRPGDYLALINSFDVVEIARAEGNAADSLGLDRGAPVIVVANRTNDEPKDETTASCGA